MVNVVDESGRLLPDAVVPVTLTVVGWLMIAVGNAFPLRLADGSSCSIKAFG